METVETTITLEGRTIMYDVTGDGPPIVFVHGVWATGGVWYPVIDELATRFRCINVHLPLGVHRYPSPRGVDHSPAALARVVAALIEKLDLHDVTLVGNDTGGALCQLGDADRPRPTTTRWSRGMPYTAPVASSGRVSPHQPPQVRSESGRSRSS